MGGRGSGSTLDRNFGRENISVLVGGGFDDSNSRTVSGNVVEVYNQLKTGNEIMESNSYRSAVESGDREKINNLLDNLRQEEQQVAQRYNDIGPAWAPGDLEYRLRTLQSAIQFLTGVRVYYH